MKINVLILSLILYSLFSLNAAASGCYSTHLEGTHPSYGRIPLVSSSLLAISSFVLKSEGDANNENKDKRDAANAGFVASGIYFYVAMHGLCKVVKRKEYEKLIAKREKLLKEGKELKDLPFQLRYIAPIPSHDEYKDMIKMWKRRQKFLQVFVAGLDTLFLYEQAQQADQSGTKNFAYLSMGAILTMVAIDYDNVWGNHQPKWVNFNIVATKINSRTAPMANITFNF